MSRVGIFIDGPNLISAGRDANMIIDFQSLLDVFKPATAVFVIASRPDGQHNPMAKTVDWLSYNGYRIVTRVGKWLDGQFKGNMDVDLAVEVLTVASNLDHIILFTGDGDFTSLVLRLQQQGKRVSIVCTLKHTADELRRQADEFIDLNSLRHLISRPEAANA